MARGAATRVASRHKRVSQAGFPDGAEMVGSTGQRSTGLIHWSHGNKKPQLSSQRWAEGLCDSGCFENNSARYYNRTFYLSGCPGNYPGSKASPFFPRFNEDSGSISVPSWPLGAAASQTVLLWPPSPGLVPAVPVHAAVGSTAEGTGRNGAAATPVWAPGPEPWRDGGSRRCREPPWARGGCRMCVPWPWPWPWSCGAPRLPYMSWGKGGPRSVETETRNILETAGRELGRLPLFCWFFLLFWLLLVFLFFSFSLLLLSPYFPVSSQPGFRFPGQPQSHTWSGIIASPGWPQPRAGGVREPLHRSGPGQARARWPCSHSQGPLCKRIVTWALNHVLVFPSGP